MPSDYCHHLCCTHSRHHCLLGCYELDEMQQSGLAAQELHSGDAVFRSPLWPLPCACLLGPVTDSTETLSNPRFGDTTGFIFPHTHRAPKSLLVKCWTVNGSPFCSEGIIEEAGNYFYLPVSAVHLRAFLGTLGTLDWEPLQVLAD